jgi:NADH:ubiquinone oxidoreductase subunit 6 (subunit J)
MPFLEKANWVVLVVAVIMFVVYLAMIVPQALSEPISEVSYAEPIVWTIVAFIVANIAGNVVAAATNPQEADKKDQRDKEIDRLGERVGNSCVVIGACAALILALIKADYFWIANAIYVPGFAAAMLSSVTKIAAYHGPFQRW